MKRAFLLGGGSQAAAAAALAHHQVRDYEDRLRGWQQRVGDYEDRLCPWQQRATSFTSASTSTSGLYTFNVSPTDVHDYAWRRT